MLQHPVLQQFVSASFPTKAMVKAHHMTDWVKTHRVCFFSFSLFCKLAMLVFLSAEFFLPSESRLGGGYLVCRVETTVDVSCH